MSSVDDVKKEADGNTFMTDVKGLNDPHAAQPHHDQQFKQPGADKEIS